MYYINHLQITFIFGCMVDKTSTSVHVLISCTLHLSVHVFS